jgi:hypothetical protein
LIHSQGLLTSAGRLQGYHSPGSVVRKGVPNHHFNRVAPASSLD